MTDDYFDDAMVNRQRLLWTVATRRQLERWEPIVARVVLGSFADRPPSGGDVWSAAIEHHFALVAARNLFRALDLHPPICVSVDPTLRSELIEGRDLHEHWRENLPVFNVTPQVTQPRHRTGKEFAARNPGRSPYWWLGWDLKTGALLLPHVSAPALHQLLDEVEAEILTQDVALGDFVPPLAASPWLHENGQWSPKADDA